MRFSKKSKLVYTLIVLSVFLSFQAFSAETKGKTTADSIIDEMIENTAGIKTLEAKLSSVNAALIRQDGIVFRFMQPGMFRIDFPDGPMQPGTTVIIDNEKIIGWMPEQNILNENPQQTVLHPAFILALDPQRIRSAASSVRLRGPDGTAKEYILDMTVADNHILNKALFNKITIHVSKNSYAVLRVGITDAEGRVSVCHATKFQKVAGTVDLPVSWKNTTPDSLFFTEFTLSDIRINSEIPDEIFKPEIPKDTLIIDSKPKTEEEYKAAIKRNTNDSRALHNYGLLLAAGNDHSAAKTQLEKLLKLRPDSVPVKLLLANALVYSKETDKAVSLCDEITKTQSISSAIRARAAEIYRLAGEKEKALFQYRKIIELYPDEETGYQHAISLMKNNHAETEKLIAQYREAASGDIGSKFVELKLNSMIQQTGQMRRIADSILGDKNLNAWMAERMADIAWKMKNYSLTMNFYEKVVELEPGYLPAYMALTGIYDQLKQTEKQVELAEKLAATRSQNPDVLTAVASIYSAAGKQNEAIKVLENSLEIVPFSQELYYNLAQLYRKVGEEEKPKELIKSLFENCPADGNTYFTAGAIYEDMKNLDEAGANYRKAMVYGNVDTFKYLRILSFYITNEMNADAELVADLIVNTSKNPREIFLAANTLLKINKTDKALEAAKAAVDVADNPSDIWAYRLFIAQIQLQKGEKSRAEIILKQLVQQEHLASSNDIYKNAQLILSGILQEQELSGKELDKYIDGLIDRMKQDGLRDHDIQDIKTALVKKGKVAAEKLLNLLDKEKFATKRFVIEILGDIGDISAAPEIRKLLDDDEPRIVLEAVKALGKIKDPRSFDKIVIILKKHEEGAVRAAAAEALGKMGDKKAVDPLIEALTDPNKKILFYVTQALVELGDRKAVDALHISLQTEESVTIKIWVAEALAHFDEEKGYNFLMGTIASGSETEVRDAILAIVNIPGEKSFDILKDCFNDINPVARQFAALTAHQKTDSDVMPLLLEALNDSDPKVRYYAVLSLGYLGKKEAIRPLEKLREREKDESVLNMIDSMLKALSNVR